MCPNSSCALHARRERAASCPLPGQPVCLSCLLSLPRERAGDCVVHSGSEPRGMLPGRGPQGGARCGARYGDAAGSCSGGEAGRGASACGRLLSAPGAPALPPDSPKSSPLEPRRVSPHGVDGARRGPPEAPRGGEAPPEQSPERGWFGGGGRGAEGVPCFE